MSEDVFKPLSYLLELVNDRTSGSKDSEKPYVGLEHIPSMGSSLTAVGAANDSISINSLFTEGDILFGKLRPRLRKSVRVAISGYCSTDVLVLRPTANVDPVFAGFVAQSDTVFSAAIRTEEGTKMPRGSWRDIKTVNVFLPSDKKAQRKIAAILTTIDTAIEKTEALIAKYQQIKAGLMHDLFTRGVLPNGQLRPPRDQAPELYQESAIGWIPRDWRLERCVELCSRICVGIVIQPTQYYVTDGVPAFRSANVREVGIDPSDLVYISPYANAVLAKSQIKTGDILSVRTGYPGTSAVVPPEFNGANCIDILISSPNSTVRSEYLCDWINSTFGKEQVLRQQGGMAQQHFNVGEMRELLVALPQPAEQCQITNRSDSIRIILRVEAERLQKLRQQKLGLMQDLLTGKVPVPVDAPETAPRP